MVVFIAEMLCAFALDLQQGLFKVAMKNNSLVSYVVPFLENPLTQLWKNISSSPVLSHMFLKYLKLVKLGTILVFGSVEDEWCFLSLKFTKSRLRGQLGKNLHAIVQTFGQLLYMENFLDIEAIESRRQTTKHYQQGIY